MKTTHYIAMAALAAILASGCTVQPHKQSDAAPVQAAPAVDVEQLGMRAEQAMAAGKLVEAGQLYVQLVTAAPNSVPGWYRLGVVYLRTNQPAYAQQAFERALALDPSLAKAHANLALAHLGQFRVSAGKALASGQISEENRRALTALVQDVEHVLPPVDPMAIVR
jgi:Tfp pilus assembly protein PilF